MFSFEILLQVPIFVPVVLHYFASYFFFHIVETVEVCRIDPHILRLLISKHRQLNILKIDLNITIPHIPQALLPLTSGYLKELINLNLLFIHTKRQIIHEYRIVVCCVDVLEEVIHNLSQ